MRFTATLLLIGAATTTTVFAQIPDFLTTDFAENLGNQELEVVYGPNKLQDGEQMSLDDVQSLPTFKLCDSCGIAPNTNYIIMLLDVDSGSDPETSQTLHYLKTDFGSDLGGTGLVSTEDALIPFLPPSVEDGSGPHRYVWLLFHQKRTIDGDAITGVPSEEDRASFSVTEWLAANEGINSPDSGVHFVVEFGEEGTFTPAPSPSATRSRGTPTRIVDEPTETPEDDDETEDGDDSVDDGLTDGGDGDDGSDDGDDGDDSDGTDGTDDIPTGTPIVTGDSPEITEPTSPAEADGAASGLMIKSGAWVASVVVVVVSMFAL